MAAEILWVIIWKDLVGLLFNYVTFHKKIANIAESCVGLIKSHSFPVCCTLLGLMLRSRFSFYFQALQEFCDLCSSSDNEDVEAVVNVKTSSEGMRLVLPYWPRLYSRLASDLDRRVRESTQKAHFVGEMKNFSNDHLKLTESLIKLNTQIRRGCAPSQAGNNGYAFVLLLRCLCLANRAHSENEWALLIGY